jgi:hypothetical protein
MCEGGRIRRKGRIKRRGLCEGGRIRRKGIVKLGD